MLYFAATLHGASFYYNCTYNSDILTDLYLNDALTLHFVLLVFLLKGLCKKN